MADKERETASGVRAERFVQPVGAIVFEGQEPKGGKGSGVLVFAHTQDANGLGRNERLTFSRVPCVGEHFVLSFTGGWHRVDVVAHCPFSGAEFDAEVYASPVDHNFVKRPWVAALGHKGDR